MAAKPILRKIAKFQTTIIIAIFYFIVGLPVFLLMKVFRYDPLKARLRNDSFWQDRKQNPQELENYMSQY